jgi:hypothetical protein
MVHCDTWQRDMSTASSPIGKPYAVPLTTCRTLVNRMVLIPSWCYTSARQYDLAAGAVSEQTRQVHDRIASAIIIFDRCGAVPCVCVFVGLMRLYKTAAESSFRHQPSCVSCTSDAVLGARAVRRLPCSWSESRPDTAATPSGPHIVQLSAHSLHLAVARTYL